jgi:hypothetical protein
MTATSTSANSKSSSLSPGKLGLVACTALVVGNVIGSGAQTVLYGFVLLLAGIPLYVWLKRT